MMGYISSNGVSLDVIMDCLEALCIFFLTFSYVKIQHSFSHRSRYIRYSNFSIHVDPQQFLTDSKVYIFFDFHFLLGYISIYIFYSPVSHIFFIQPTQHEIFQQFIRSASGLMQLSVLRKSRFFIGVIRHMYYIFFTKKRKKERKKECKKKIYALVWLILQSEYETWKVYGEWIYRS